MNPEPKKIVLVEDEKHIRELLAYHLEKNKYTAHAYVSAEEARPVITTLAPHLIVLDLMLPKMSGLEFCKELKKNPKTKDVAILMLTAKSSKEDIIQGLELGADDYVTKPFDIREVMARIQAILRRNGTKESVSSIFSYQDLKIDWERYQATQGSLTQGKKELSFTQTEFKILKALTSHQGKVLTRDQLLDLINAQEKAVIDRNIDVHILSIRKKCGKDQSYIETIRGIGYRFKDTPQRADHEKSF